MSATSTASPRVETYRLKTASGRHIRLATKVTFPDGRVVRFMERMSARAAIQQAREQLARHPEYDWRDSKRPKRARTMKMSEEAKAASSYIAASLRELRTKDGYVVFVNIGPYDHNANDYPLPDARFPKVFKALYEAVAYAEQQLRYHDKLKIMKLTPSGEPWPPFHSQVVWRSWGTWETEDRERQRRRRSELAKAKTGRTLEHVRRDARRHVRKRRS